MATLNQITSVVSKMSERLDGDRSVQSKLLNLNFDVAKLWLATQKEDKQELQKRVANLFVGSFIMADVLGYKDIEAVISQRLAELKQHHVLGNEENELV